MASRALATTPPTRLADGDLDAALGLVVANKVWGGYLTKAQSLIGKIKQFEIPTRVPAAWVGPAAAGEAWGGWCPVAKTEGEGHIRPPSPWPLSRVFAGAPQAACRPDTLRVRASNCLILADQTTEPGECSHPTPCSQPPTGISIPDRRPQPRWRFVARGRASIHGPVDQAVLVHMVGVELPQLVRTSGLIVVICGQQHSVAMPSE